MFKIADQKTNEQIAAEWDEIAGERIEDIRAGKDRTYIDILVPAILDELENAIQRRSTVRRCLDVGCGVGYLTQAASFKYRRIRFDGVDISRASILLATDFFGGSNCYFENQSIEKFTPVDEYDIAIASMFLMDCPDYMKCLSKISNCLKKTGSLIISMTHPCFWPIYRGFDKEEWFDYMVERAIESPFTTSSTGVSSHVTTYFHRPLQNYFKALSENDFSIIVFKEIGNNVLYKSGQLLPRHLLIHALRI